MKFNRSNLVILGILAVCGIGSSLTVFSDSNTGGAANDGNKVTGVSSNYSCESADTDVAVKKTDNAKNESQKTQDAKAKSVGGSSN